MQRYDTIFIYPNELTLINIILYLYTFSLTYTYARTLYKTRKGTDAHQYRQKASICVYLCRMVVFFSSSVRQKGIQKNEMQIKPIHGTKMFKGRVAPPPLWDASLGVYPTSNFFLIFFCSNSFSNFFLVFL